MNYYHFNGLVIASEIELAVLPTATDHQAAVFVHLGKVPTTLNEPIKQTPTYEISHHQALIKLPGIGHFLVEQGTRITIEPDKQCKLADLCTFVIGVVWAPLSYQQGKSLLKGALISIENQNWLISGISPIGISTFALAMQTHCGARVLSDEFCSYQFNEQGILADTGIPALKLWQKSLSHFELNHQSLTKVRAELNKYWLPLARPTEENHTLHGIIALQEWRSDETSPVGIKQLSGFKALKKAYQHSFHPAYIQTRHDLKQKFQQDLQLVQQCKISSFTFKREFKYLQDSCQYLRQWITP